MANAGYWIDEFHMDGLRLDATQDIHDSSGDHILAAVTRRARQAAGQRSILIVGENEPQHAYLVQTPEHGGYGIDALWNDDFRPGAALAHAHQSRPLSRHYSPGSAGAVWTATGDRFRGDRLLILNLGTDLRLAPEPLLAPPQGMRWAVLWSSEDPCYGGNGTPPLETDEHWYIPGHAAVVLTPTLDTQGDTRANANG